MHLRMHVGILIYGELVLVGVVHVQYSHGVG